jgi:hypothetical protein
MARHSTPSTRDLMSSHNTGAGKGDADRSPGWRDGYEEIDWKRDLENDGFTQVGHGRYRKVYGPKSSFEEIPTGN